MAVFDHTNALNEISSRYTPDQRQKDEAERIELIGALKPRIDPNSYEQRVARAKQQIAGIIDQLEMLNDAPPSELKTNRLNQANKRLAELFAETGDVLLAAASSTDPAQKEWFDKLLAAIEKDDSETCECTNDRMMDNVKKIEVTIPARIMIGEFPSAKYGRNVKVEQCVKCGDLNAR